MSMSFDPGEMKSLGYIYALWLLSLEAALASIAIEDPSDVINPQD